MSLKLLAVGDMHLGRLPTRLPPELAGDRARELGPAAAWERAVSAALEARVDAVVLAGDVVEQEHDFFEGYRELQRGIARLVEAGVRTLAVAGNHDVQVLPRLADQIPGFELLGRGGCWERKVLGTGSERLTLHGWSFPERRVLRSPLAGVRLERGEGVNLGLLHCDRDQPDSRYAPVSSADLEQAGLDGWLLGHVHAPDPLSIARCRGYLGSLSGLHVGETGPRGPWLLEVAEGRIAALCQWPLAPLHWERLEVDLTGLAEPEDARERLLVRLAELDAELGTRARPPLAAGVRVSFVGRTDRRRAVQRLLDGENLDEIRIGAGGIHYFVERIRFATQPVLDLGALARRPDPPGLLARRLALLARPAGDPERGGLLAGARAHLEARAGQRYWQRLDDPEPDDEAVADWLRRGALLALERLLDRGEPGE